MNFGRFFEWRFAMRKFPKILTGAAAAALVTLAAAAPAQAQWRDYDDDIDLGDIAAGIAIIGGAAIAIDALTDNDRYDRYGRYGRTYGGYYDGYRYGGPQASVNACARTRSEEHTSELQSLMRNSYAVFCLKTKKPQQK